MSRRRRQDSTQPARWSVDHRFLDRDAVPTLVEVKRSSDTRIRREVVGQMLDCTANGVVYRPPEQLRELFARRCEREDVDPHLVISGRGGVPRVIGQSAEVEAREGRRISRGQRLDHDTLVAIIREQSAQASLDGRREAPSDRPTRRHPRASTPRPTAAPPCSDGVLC